VSQTAEETYNPNVRWGIAFITFLLCSIYIVLSWFLDGPTPGLMVWIVLAAFFFGRAIHHARRLQERL
jgi:hypothetical protein